MAELDTALCLERGNKNINYFIPPGGNRTHKFRLRSGTLKPLSLAPSFSSLHLSIKNMFVNPANWTKEPISKILMNNIIPPTYSSKYSNMFSKLLPYKNESFN